MIYLVNMNDNDEVLEGIKNYVERIFKVNLLKETRKREVVYSRALYYKLCREHSDKSLEEIGKLLNKDHSTVLHGLNNTFPTIYRYEEAYRDAYLEFNVANDIFTADYLIGLRNKLSRAEDIILRCKGYYEEPLRKAI